MQRVGKTNVRLFVIARQIYSKLRGTQSAKYIFCIPVVPFWFAFVASQTEVCKPYLFSCPDFCFDVAAAASAREICIFLFHVSGSWVGHIGGFL